MIFFDRARPRPTLAGMPQRRRAGPSIDGDGRADGRISSAIGPRLGNARRLKEPAAFQRESRSRQIEGAAPERCQGGLAPGRHLSNTDCSATSMKLLKSLQTLQAASDERQNPPSYQY